MRRTICYLAVFAFAITACAGEIVPISVPDLSGMALVDARDRAAQLDLKLEEVDGSGSDRSVLSASNWTVEGQEPDPGAAIDPGGTVIVSLVNDRDRAPEADDEPEPEPEPETEPESEPEPKTAAAPGTYGSDPVLDQLQDRCAAGDADACDELYWDSPLGSEYEAFAMDRTEPSLGDDELTDAVSELAMLLAWNGMTSVEQGEFCLGYELLGPEISHAYFADGYGEGAPTLAAFEDFFGSVC